MTHYLKKSEEEEENNKLFALIHFLLNSEKYSILNPIIKSTQVILRIIIWIYIMFKGIS